MKRICTKGHHNKTFKGQPISGPYRITLRQKRSTGAGWCHKCSEHHQRAVRFNLFAFAAFISFQARDICSQQPETLDMQSFWRNRSINLFFLTIWSSNGFHKRLKNNLPSTFKRAIGQNSSMDSGLGGFIFGI